MTDPDEQFDPGTILNRGVIPHIPRSHDADPTAQPRTLIMTGLARSGTSMLADMLRAGGVWQGDHVFEPIIEDAEIGQLLRARDLSRLDALIARRNAMMPVWGFKLPNLHHFLKHSELARFRNPLLLIMYRDPVAVTVRNILSEQAEGIAAIIDATAAMHAMTQFAFATKLPVLFLSYEKALQFGTDFIDSVATFCGIAVDDRQRAAMLDRIEPNRPDYVAIARDVFEGQIEGIVDGRLCGWARNTGRVEPILLDLLIDDRPAATFTAGEFRSDLMMAGLGNGSHAFFVDLGGFVLSDASVIRVRVNRRTVELPNSGLTLREMRALRPPP